MRKITCLFAFLSALILAHGAPCYAFSFSLGGGLFSNGFLKASTSDSGKKDLFSSLTGSLNVMLDARFHFPMGAGWEFSTGLGIEPLGKGSADNAARTRDLLFHAQFASSLAPKVQLLASIGSLWSWVSGKGGSIELGNGNTTTTFNLPEGSSISKVWYLGTGVAFPFTNSIRLDIDVLIPGILTNRRVLVSFVRFGVVF